MKYFFQRIHNSAEAWSFLATFLRVGANVFVLPFILRKVPSEQLGIWYIFGTIGGLAGLLDLGFEFTITRMTSYAWSGATRFIAFGIHQDDHQTDREPNLALLRELIATLKAYYFYVGMGVLALLTLGGGGYIWVMTQNLDSAASLRMAWLIYAGGCCLNFVIGRWPALLTGVGAVREAQLASIVSLVFYYAIVTAGLLGGLGIWALVIGFLGMGLVARHQGRKFFEQSVALPEGLPKARFNRLIFQSIWPNAWRMGVVCVGAFLTIQANTLVCSFFLGLAATASYGLSFQLVAMLVGLCNIWVAVKLPLINQLRLQGRHTEIASLFARRIRLTILSYIAGALIIIFVAPHAMRWLGSKTSLIPTGQLAFLAFIRLMELHHSLYATLVLTENHNPFLKSTLIFGSAILLASLTLTPLYGMWGLLLAMGGVPACYNNWWPVLRALRGLELSPRIYFRQHYLRPKAWLELF